MSDDEEGATVTYRLRDPNVVVFARLLEVHAGIKWSTNKEFCLALQPEGHKDSMCMSGWQRQLGSRQ